MKSFRGAIGWLNECGFGISIALWIGYNGSRHLFGLFPGAISISIVAALGLLAYQIASAQAATIDDYSERPKFATLDKFIVYSLLFIFGLCLAVTLGASL
jgi:hypothetical protein